MHAVQERDGNGDGAAQLLQVTAERGCPREQTGLKLESVTGKATIYVYQDFLALILVYNMIQDIRNSANAKVCKRARYRYCVQTNENLAIGLFKEKMVVLEALPAMPERKICPTSIATIRNSAFRAHRFPYLMEARNLCALLTASRPCQFFSRLLGLPSPYVYDDK